MSARSYPIAGNYGLLVQPGKAAPAVFLTPWEAKFLAKFPVSADGKKPE